MTAVGTPVDGPVDTRSEAPRKKRRPIVVLADPLQEAGAAVLRDGGLDVRDASRTPADLPALLRDADALIVRSRTRVDAALLANAPHLSVVGRAGVGVDTIDVAAATARGIVVVNTPGSSTLATAEHSMALMLALCRHVAMGGAQTKKGNWSTSGLIGTELADKTLAVIGFGRIGAAVAARARAFGMTVLTVDPVASEARCRAAGVELASFEHALAHADVVTLHVPLAAGAPPLMDAAAFARMKPGALLVNCARGGLLDEAALLDALDTEKLAGAALDVLAQEPPQPDSLSLRVAQHPKTLVTPHLGASTREAQERIAADLCRDVVNVLRGGPPANAVNAPSLASAALQPFAELARLLGHILPQIAQVGERGSAALLLEGDLTEQDAPVLVAAFLTGLLPRITERRVSTVNAVAVAAEVGIAIECAAGPCERGYARALSAEFCGRRVAGTIVHGTQLRLVEVDGYEIDVAPVGDLVLTRHRDVPGIVGAVGTMLGHEGVNISSMQVARDGTGRAIMLLALDRAPQAPVLATLRALDGVEQVATVSPCG
jgi:D-3-phosphoglycerate dehydrogenase